VEGCDDGRPMSCLPSYPSYFLPMQVDLSANSLTRDAKLLLKSAAQAANCTLMLDDSETVERQERKEREEVDTVDCGAAGPGRTEGACPHCSPALWS
jgi:hypothetical protein